METLKNQAIFMRTTVLNFLFSFGVLLVISFFTNHTLGWAADLTFQALKTKKLQKVELVVGTSVVIEAPNRIFEACKELQHSNVPVANVAYSVGFNDPSYFARVFRRFVGLSPSVYCEQISPAILVSE